MCVSVSICVFVQYLGVVCVYFWLLGTQSLPSPLSASVCRGDWTQRVKNKIIISVNPSSVLSIESVMRRSNVNLLVLCKWWSMAHGGLHIMQHLLSSCNCSTPWSLTSHDSSLPIMVLVPTMVYVGPTMIGQNPELECHPMEELWIRQICFFLT